MKKMKKALALVGAVGLLSGATLTAASAETAPQASEASAETQAQSQRTPYKEQTWKAKFTFEGDFFSYGASWFDGERYVERVQPLQKEMVFEYKVEEDTYLSPEVKLFSERIDIFSNSGKEFTDDDGSLYEHITLDLSEIPESTGHEYNIFSLYVHPYIDGQSPEFSLSNKPNTPVVKDMPDDFKEKMKKKFGFAVSSVEVSFTEKTVYKSNTRNFCWKPAESVLSSIDFDNSRGISRVGDTVVIPDITVRNSSSSQIEDQYYIIPANIVYKDKAGELITISDLALSRLGGGAASVSDNLSFLSNHYFGIPTRDYAGPIYSGPSMGLIPDFHLGNFEVHPDLESFTGVSNFVAPGEKSYYALSAEDMGTLDIGCTQNPALAAQGLALLDSNGKFTGDVNQLTFKDVPAGTQFSDEISWLASTGITTGWPDGTDRPLSQVERGAMAAFFYRMAGKPEFTAPAVSPFSDVKPGDPFYKEITWMKAQGITTGYDDGTFRAHDSVNRDAMAAFFYRFAGKPAYSAPAQSAFKDIKAGDQFYKEVSWLASKKISTGWSVVGGAEFRPVSAINRDAMAAFIYRYNSNVAPVSKK